MLGRFDMKIMFVFPVMSIKNIAIYETGTGKGRRNLLNENLNRIFSLLHVT
jgi:hypothetical protein